MSYGAIFGKTGKSGFYPTLTITPVGAVFTSVTATSSTGQVYNATQQDSQWFVQVNDFDTYTVTGNYTDGSVSQDVDVVVNQNYDVTLTVASTTLNDNSWEIIRAIADAGIGENYWAVGDAKQITINATIGILTLDNYQPYVYILGFNHNANLEGQNMIHFGLGTTALNGGTNIALVDNQYNTIGNSNGFRMYTNQTNNGGWQSSYMRQTIINANATSPTNGSTNSFLAALPSDLQNVLKQCTKYTDNVGNGTGNIQSNITPTQDWMFLLSEYEVIGYISFSNTYEQNYQKQYQYYIDGNSKIKHKHNDTNTQCVWWIRSLMATSTVYFCTIEYPNPDGYIFSNYSFGFAPAFCV